MRAQTRSRFGRFLRHPALAVIACGAAAWPALADTALLRNGRVLAVSGFRMEGQRIVLAMEGGGEIALAPENVLEIRRSLSSRGSATAPSPAPPAGTPAMVGAAAPRGDGDPGTPGAALSDGGPRLVAPPAGALDREGLRDLAARIARRHQVDAALVHAVIEVESQYNPRAVSPRGAVGLMQLMPQTAARFAVGDPLDPAENLDGGVRYLKELLGRYSGQVRLALAAYNAGEEAVERFSGIPPYRETVNYVERVRRMMRR
jgi:hypothetical protein